jgi:predicted DNA-binding transcriptional regulator AlpA
MAATLSDLEMRIAALEIKVRELRDAAGKAWIGSLLKIKTRNKIVSNNTIALSVSATAESIGISRSQLYQLIKEGKGPQVTKIVKRTVILITDRDAWLKTLAQ